MVRHSFCSWPRCQKHKGMQRVSAIKAFEHRTRNIEHRMSNTARATLVHKLIAHYFIASVMELHIKIEPSSTFGVLDWTSRKFFTGFRTFQKQLQISGSCLERITKAEWTVSMFVFWLLPWINVSFEPCSGSGIRCSMFLVRYSIFKTRQFHRTQRLSKAATKSESCFGWSPEQKL